MIRSFGWAIGLTVVALGVALGFGGPSVLLTVLILGVLEVSLSFDNAVVNAKVLNRMHPLWQRLFLTVGILIAVFGMRLVLPILIVVGDDRGVASARSSTSRSTTPPGTARSSPRRRARSTPSAAPSCS